MKKFSFEQYLKFPDEAKVWDSLSFRKKEFLRKIILEAVDTEIQRRKM